MKYGSTDWDAIAKKINRTPQAVLDQPTLYYPFVWRLFSSLSMSRSSGMAVGAIDPVSFIAVCDIYGLKNREDLWDIIQRVDRTFLKHDQDANRNRNAKNSH